MVYFFTGTEYSTVIKENNLLTTLPFLGKEFEISLDVFVSAFTVPNMQWGNYAEILRLTTTNNDCCKKGDRIVALFTRKDNSLIPITHIGENYNYAPVFGSIKVDKWINVRAKQFMDTKTGKVDIIDYTLILITA